MRSCDPHISSEDGAAMFVINDPCLTMRTGEGYSPSLPYFQSTLFCRYERRLT